MLLVVASRALKRGLTYVGLTLLFLSLAYAALQIKKARADGDTCAAHADEASAPPGRVIGQVNAQLDSASKVSRCATL